MATPTIAPTMGPTEDVPADVMMAVFGVVMALLGPILTNVGNNMQSLAMHKLELEVLKNQRKDLDRRQAENPHELALFDDDLQMQEIKPTESKDWIVGTCVFVLGSIANFVALAFAPATILAPLGTSGVLNLIFAHGFLGVRLAWKQKLGALAIVIGVLLIVASALVGGQAVPELTIPELLELYGNMKWIGYCICSVVMLVVCGFTHRRYQEKASRTVLQVTDASWIAVFAAQLSVQAKNMATLMVFNGFFSETFWGHWFTYTTFFGLVALKVVSARSIDGALCRYDPIVFIPLAQTIDFPLAIIGGGLYFKEFETFTLVQSILYVVGVVGVLVGTNLLVPHDDANKEVDMDPKVVREMMEMATLGSIPPPTAIPHPDEVSAGPCPNAHC